MSALTMSQVLARFAVEARSSDLPAPVRDKVATHLLDVLGVVAASAGQGFAAAMRAVARGLGGPPESVGVGLPDRLGAPGAALLNGALAHGIDYDDTHLASIVHPSATVTPAALATAEEVDADGEELVRAIALGLETAVRVGLAARGSLQDRGFHATPIAGVLGATVAAGSLYRLDVERLVWSLGLAASMAGGLLEFLTDGTSAKRLHGGWAAHGGILAARLAREGLSGPAGGLDGRFGLLPALLGDRVEPERAVEGIGRRWELLDIALKPYPCCHFLHAFLDAAAELRREIGAPLGEPANAELLDRIERVECGVPPPVIPVVCEPAATKRRPQTPYDAQFSLPFGVSVMLARGRVVLSDFSEESIRDDGLLALAERVTIVAEPRTEFPRRFPGRVRLRLRDGLILEREKDDNRGGPSAPLRRAEVEAKFRANVSTLLGPVGADEVIERVWAWPAPRARRLMEPFRCSLGEVGEGPR